VSWHTPRAILLAYAYKRGAKRNMLMPTSDQSTVGSLPQQGVVEADCSSACMLERPISLVGTACLGVLVVDLQHGPTLVPPLGFEKTRHGKSTESRKRKEMALAYSLFGPSAWRSPSSSYGSTSSSERSWAEPSNEPDGERSTGLE